jgi:hypothetical protein
MNNLLEIINDQIDGISAEEFIINTDSKAELALSKLREEQAELKRFELICNEMISQYQFKIQRAQEIHNNKVLGLKTQLQNYFETVPKHTTKTQETYKLPSGTLKRKFGGVEFIKDEAKLLQWVKDNGGKDDFIQVKETVKWAELKKRLIQKDDCMLTEDGEVVPGVELQKKPDKFEIEVI